MSDLAATNCNNGCGCGTHEGGCSWIIIILLLLSCSGGNSCFGDFGRGGDCSCIILILLILCACGNGNSFF